MNRVKSFAVGTAFATACTGGVMAAGGPAQAAAPCTVNIYRVNHTPSAVYDAHGKLVGRKKVGDTVQGPNSRVAAPITVKGWRKVYLRDQRLGWMWAKYLTYRRCR